MRLEFTERSGAEGNLGVLILVKTRRLVEITCRENANRARSKSRAWGSGPSELRKHRGSSKGDGEGAVSAEGEPAE